MQPKKKPVNKPKYSISKKLREKNKSNDLFEIMLGNLTIEEIIALKLELAIKSIGQAAYGIPIWKSINFIVKDAVLKFALANNSSKTKAAKFLGMKNIDFYELIKRYKTKEYFEETGVT